MTDLKYRVGFDSEESFTPENSNIREANGWITITFRGSKELLIFGDMTWVPFHLFYVEFHFELSHFEMQLDSNSFKEVEGWNETSTSKKNYLFRFMMHKHVKLEEMLGIKIDAKESTNVSIAYPFSKVRRVKELKDNKKSPEKSLTYLPGAKFEIAFYQ